MDRFGYSDLVKYNMIEFKSYQGVSKFITYISKKRLLSTVTDNAICITFGSLSASNQS